MPEAGVIKGHELTVGSQRHHRLRFPYGQVAFDAVEDLRRQDKEPAIDQPAVAPRLLGEPLHEIAISLERPVAPRGSHRRHRRLLAVTAVEGDQRRDIDVAHSVAVREAEGLFIADVVGHPLEPSAGHGRFAGVDERHLPGLRLTLVDRHRVEGDVEGDVGHVEEVVGEILLDQIALIAAADHEVVHAMGGIELHDVPENRPAADLDHRLRLEVGLFRDPSSQAASENDCFHRRRGRRAKRRRRVQKTGTAKTPWRLSRSYR